VFFSLWVTKKDLEGIGQGINTPFSTIKELLTRQLKSGT
jgi:hypothetical protein